MTSVPSGAVGNDRRAHVLRAALGVFGRHGFRKASMDEVARAADISRQGLYLYFENKENLFQEAIRLELETALNQAGQALDADGPVANRLGAALDAWYGRFVGSYVAADLDALLEHSVARLGDLAAEMTAAFETQLARVIAQGTVEVKCARLGVRPEQVAVMLRVLARGWKHEATDRSTFLAEVTASTTLVLASLGPEEPRTG